MKTLRLGILLFLCSASVMLAQNSRIMLQIEPTGNPSNNYLTIQPGQQIQFTARAYEYLPNGQRQEIQLPGITWTVDPTYYGTISSNGLFVASQGLPPNGAPTGKIIARAPHAGLMLEAHVLIMFQQTQTPTLVLRIEPLPPTGQSTWHLQPGQTVQFTAKAYEVLGSTIVREVPVSQVTWQVDPSSIGTITSNGEFTAAVNLPPNTNPTGRILAQATANGQSLTATITVVIQNTQTSNYVLRIEPSASSGNNYIVVQPGQTIRFTAKAYDYTDPRNPREIPLNQVVWSLDPQNFGTISSNGEFTAPTTIPPGVLPHIRVIARAAVGGMSLETFVIVLVQTSNIQHYQITGIVTDEANNPIHGAVVTADGTPNFPSSGGRYSAVTDNTGVYTLKLPEGTYIVRATANGYLPEYFDNVKTANLATPVTVNSTNPTQANVNFALGTGGKITGTVTRASDNAPIANARVMIYGSSQSGGSPNNTAYGILTDQNGVYAITGLTTGNYIIYVEANGFEKQYFDKVPLHGQATPVNVIEGQTTSGIDFSLLALAGISGTVVDAANNTPISNAEIIVTGVTLTITYKTMTDRSGFYHLPVPAGTYKVRASAPGYSTEWYDGQADPTLANDVVVAQGTVTQNINFTLGRWGGSITGTVKDDLGNPIQNANVRAWAATTNPSQSNTHRYFGTATTDANGIYHITGVPPGNYFVSATATGYLTEYYDNVYQLSQAAQVAVAINQPTTGIDFALSKGGSISGQVVDAVTNAPIAYACVSVGMNTTSANAGVAARTDANGMYTITGLPTGNYVVFAAAYKFRGEYYDNALTPQLATPVAVTAPNTTTGINFALDTMTFRTHPFTGSVVDAVTKKAIPFTFVEGINTQTGEIEMTTTNDQGAFEFRGDEFTILRTRAIGYNGSYAGNTNSWNDSRAACTVGGMPFDLLPVDEAGFGALRGQVRDAVSQLPLINAWIYGQDIEGNTYFATTDVNGEFEFTGTTVSDIDIMVSKVMYHPTEQTFTFDGLSGQTMLFANKAGVTGIDRASLPVSITLEQNYPNPFNPSTTIEYSLPAAAKVTLRVYTILGQEIATLVDAAQEAGLHRVVWTAKSTPSGVYVYKIEANGTTVSRRMILLK